MARMNRSGPGSAAAAVAAGAPAPAVAAADTPAAAAAAAALHSTAQPLVRKKKTRRRPRSRLHHKSWRPYSQLTAEEKLALDERDAQRVRKELVAEIPRASSGRVRKGVNLADYRPNAPHNTTSYIADQLAADAARAAQLAGGAAAADAPGGAGAGAAAAAGSSSSSTAGPRVDSMIGRVDVASLLNSDDEPALPPPPPPPPRNSARRVPPPPPPPPPPPRRARKSPVDEQLAFLESESSDSEAP